MKKTLFWAILASISILCSCEHKKVEKTSSDEAVTLSFETALSTDKQYMLLNYGENYVFYESQITLLDFIDSDNASNRIESICNVCQAVVDGQPKVVIFNHGINNDEIETHDDFWIEDFSIQDINITFDSAFSKLMNANCPKPHSRLCTLRSMIGPKDANPQFIFGNVKQQVFVDAITGSVSTINPAFDE